MALSEALTHKLGPLPIWAWGGVGIVGLIIMVMRQRSSAATQQSAATQAALQNALAGQQANLLDGSSAGGAASPVGDYLPYSGGTGYGYNPSYLCGNGSYVSDPSLCLGTPAATSTTCWDGSIVTPPAVCPTQPAAAAPAPTPAAAPTIASEAPTSAADTVGPAPCTGNDTSYCTLEYSMINGVATLPIGGEQVAMRFVDPMAAWQVASNNALAGVVAGLTPPAPYNTNPGVNQPQLAPGQLSTASFGYNPATGGSGASSPYPTPSVFPGAY